MKSFSGGDNSPYREWKMQTILLFRLQEKSKMPFLCECAFLAECCYFIQDGKTLMACCYMLNSWLEKVSSLICWVLKYLI